MKQSECSKVVKCNQKQAIEFIANLEDFEAGNLYGKCIGIKGIESIYVVFSYRDSWPIACYFGEVWNINMTKVSVTTSRHVNKIKRGLELKKLEVAETTISSLRVLIEIVKAANNK